MNIIEAMADPAVFALHFRQGQQHWIAWRTFLSALFGLPMDRSMHRIYRQCTGRITVPRNVNEAWLVCGRRSGKSFTLALIAVFLAVFKDWRPFLGPGERGTILVIAADRKQARTIMRYMTGLLRAVPMLARTIDAERAESVDLMNRVSIEIATASFRTTRGY